MRRKSERNKAKSSPEKKVEKPTRKSARRRNKRSPSTSPDRENSSSDVPQATTIRESDGESTTTTTTTTTLKQSTRLQSRESEKTIEVPESKVSSTESIPKQQDEDDGGSVWKVARADASPGEIQKLKLCRQRNMSETSDASSSRKRTNKWHDGVEGVAEEVDSADEPSSVTRKGIVDGNDTADDTNSALPGRDSSEEVSDSKEFPPEIATDEISDDKPNIDDERDIDETIQITIVTVVEREDNDHDDNQAIVTESSHAINTLNEAYEDEQNVQQIHKDERIHKDKLDEPDKKNEENRKEETTIVAINEETDNAKVEETTNFTTEQKLEAFEAPETVETVEASEAKESSSEDEAENISEPVKVRKHESSDDNSEDDRKDVKNTRNTLTRTSSRRKHRDKYRDSSNSDTAESEEDNETENKREEETGKSRDEDGKESEVAEDPGEEIEVSRTPETRPETPVSNDAQIEIENNVQIDANEKEIEETSKREEAIVTETQAQHFKPAKVNLKRSL